MQKITPFLWFNDNAEEAMNYYVETFRNSKVVNVSRQGDRFFSGTFSLDGHEFMALNGGPMYTFTPAVSFFVSCKDQEEVDYFWDRLIAGGGKADQCGWLTDKFGLSWQIIPTTLMELLGDKDRGRANRAMEAMLKMKKIDVAGLKKAADAS